jgi:hypothetical protein
VVAAVREADSHLDGAIVLGAEINWTGSKADIVRPTIDWQAVKSSNSSCSIALRVAPFSVSDRGSDARIQSVMFVAKSLLEDADKNQVRLQELQLDFDCAQKDLTSYRDWLPLIRAVTRSTRLVITTLPSWLDEPAFAELIREVDGYVLQVHSVPRKNGTTMTLCDPKSAQAWVEKAARLHVPFSVALPTYRCSAGYNKSGKLLGVAMDSVQPVWPPNTRVLEFSANPDDIARLVRRWQKSRPPELKELLWYRIPVATDTRNWQWTTLTAVMAGRKPLHRLEVFQNGENPIDFSIANTGEADAEINSVVTATWNGEKVVASDALPGWTLNLKNGRAVFTTTSQMRLAPGANRQIGWLRYEQPVSVQVKLANKNETGR